MPAAFEHLACLQALVARAMLFSKQCRGDAGMARGRDTTCSECCTLGFTF